MHPVSHIVVWTRHTHTHTRKHAHTLHRSHSAQTFFGSSAPLGPVKLVQGKCKYHPSTLCSSQCAGNPMLQPGPGHTPTQQLSQTLQYCLFCNNSALPMAMNGGSRRHILKHVSQCTLHILTTSQTLYKAYRQDNVTQNKSVPEFNGVACPSKS